MSALSDVDLRDFERVDVDVLEECFTDTDSWAEYPALLEWCETIRRIQKKLIQQTPALFKP